MTKTLFYDLDVSEGDARKPPGLDDAFDPAACERPDR